MRAFARNVSGALRACRRTARCGSPRPRPAASRVKLPVGLRLWPLAVVLCGTPSGWWVWAVGGPLARRRSVRLARVGHLVGSREPRCLRVVVGRMSTVAQDYRSAVRSTDRTGSSVLTKRNEPALASEGKDAQGRLERAALAASGLLVGLGLRLGGSCGGVEASLRAQRLRRPAGLSTNCALRLAPTPPRRYGVAAQTRQAP